MRKKGTEDEQTLEELNSANCHSQSKLFLFLPYNKHLINLAKSARSVGENLEFGRVYKPHCSVYTYDLGQESPIQTSCSVN